LMQAEVLVHCPCDCTLNKVYACMFSPDVAPDALKSFFPVLKPFLPPTKLLSTFMLSFANFLVQCVTLHSFARRRDTFLFHVVSTDKPVILRTRRLHVDSKSIVRLEAAVERQNYQHL